MFKLMSACVLLSLSAGLAQAAEPICFGTSQGFEKICLKLSRDGLNKQVTTVSIHDENTSVDLGAFSRSQGDLVIQNKHVGRRLRLEDVARIKIPAPWTKQKRLSAFNAWGGELGVFTRNVAEAYDPEVGDVSKVVSSPVTSSSRISQEDIIIPGVRLVTSMAQDPSNRQRLFAVGFSIELSGSVLLRSEDAGATWETILDLKGSSQYYNTVSVSADGRKVVVLGSNSFGKSAKVFFSVDGGASFDSITHVPKATKLIHVYSVHVNAAGTNVYVGESQGWVTKYDLRGRSLVRSTANFGQILQHRLGNATPQSAWGISTHPEVPGKVFVGTGNHLYRLDEAGRVDEFSSGVYDDSTIYNVEFLANKGLRMSACNAVYETVPGYNYTSDQKPTFRKRRSASFVIEKGAGLVSTPGYLRTYWVHASPFNNNEVLAGAMSGLYRSVDGGNTWKRLLIFDAERSQVMVEYHQVAFIDRDTIVVVHSKQGNRPAPIMSRIHLR